MNTIRPFHLAIPVSNLESSRLFYRDVLGCTEGRSSAKWVDFNFFGHQFVIHEVDYLEKHKEKDTNPVDGHNVPVPHFGVVLSWNDWENLAEKLKAINIAFIIEPYIRFKGEVCEQATMFFLDPEGNPLEFKAFKEESQLFAK
jgi:extradiol dioxygenase family protein